MKSTQRGALALVLLSCGISILWALALGSSAKNGSLDFQAIYYGSRCLVQHSDPYKEIEFLRVFRAEGGEFPSDPTTLRVFRRAVPVCINLPTTLFLISPLAMLAWGPAHVLWMILLAASLTLAAFLMRNLGGSNAPGVSIFLICIVLANSEILFSGGNIAGVAVSLCMVAAWCFLKNRYAPLGVLCLALSLLVKPHDSVLVWLYFLLVGGVYRKRALQTLIVVFVLALPAILWVSQVAPDWMTELRSNLSATSARGDLSDPGPTSITMRIPVRIIDLQTVISVFRDDPHTYNPVSYMVCGALLLAWSVRTLRSSFSQTNALLALAAIVPLTMLPTYHRSYDAKLLLLTVPACAMLWAEGGRIGKIAFLLNSAGVILTGDIPSAILTILYDDLHLNTTGIFGQILTIVMTRNAPLILLAMGIFYLWVYLRRIPDRVGTLKIDGTEKTPITPGLPGLLYRRNCKCSLSSVR